MDILNLLEAAMADVAPRCPFCAHALKITPSLLERIGLKKAVARCPMCKRVSEARDARSMGAAYWHWSEQFRAELALELEELPILDEPTALKVLGIHQKQDAHASTSADDVLHTCLRHHHHVLMEMARGRDATLETALLLGPLMQTPEAAAVLGTSSVASGSREWQQIVVRVGPLNYLVYAYPRIDGAEPRVKRAVHSKHRRAPGAPAAPRAAAPVPQKLVHARPA
jgi:hypothetical protein